MKLLTEVFDQLQYQTLNEETSGKKSYHLAGIFMQSERANRNNRTYPRGVMEEAVREFMPKIAEKRALGELGHPEKPDINLDRVSHLITHLEWDGNNVIGKAKVLDTPNGNIVKNFIDEGVKLGVSSRGLGMVQPMKGGLTEVKKGYILSTVDIVADPSAHEAFVEGLHEGKEWVMVNGMWTMQEAEAARNDLEDAAQKELLEIKMTVFKQFFKHLGNTE